MLNPDVDPERVEIRIISPQHPVRSVSVRLSGQIQALQSLWPDSPKKFICGGIELMQEMTFAQSGIRKGEAIIALPLCSKSPIADASLWLNLTRDHTCFNECMQWMLDTRTSGEAARLRDLRLMKMDRRPRVFMKMCSHFLQTDTQTQWGDATTIPGQSLLSPSTEALPIFWNVSCPQFQFEELGRTKLESE
jgi:hypothetical protein